MKKSLVIVESPAKAKTISKFLGNRYEVIASYGHIRDLPGSAGEIPEAIRGKPWARLAVDTENDFKPVYVVPRGSAKHVKELRKQIKDADELILATDEDREGESISWHLLELLKPKVSVRRITFHEITKAAIEEALAHPRDVDDKLVRAQESRRILDRLYGYSLSPVLWKKVRTKLSAGRVQSVAVRLVVEREEERLAFHSAVYWDVEARLRGEKHKDFTATLIAVGDRRIPNGKDFDPSTGQPKSQQVIVLNQSEAEKLARQAPEQLPWTVVRVEKKQQKKRPSPPFITSTLQQAASSQLNLSPGRTMAIAQRLYEGVDLGGGEREGLITYMRTDSVTLSERAIASAAGVIQSRFGKEYYQGPRRYQTKSKSAQEAHEAIRPTELSRSPDQVAKFLDGPERALYELIWRRTLASQMADAVLEKTAADIEVHIDGTPHTFRANGSIVRFPGFLKVADGNSQETVLPELHQGQKVVSQAEAAAAPDCLALLETSPARHETSPPARYTEATLVRKLEEEGIGRPSTYAPTISTIQQRGYVVKRKGALVPTFVGMAVVNLLRDHFARYVDLKFTANMEESLDDIAKGNREWLDFLRTFYRGNSQSDKGLVEHIKDELPRIDYPAIPVGNDPETGEPLTVRIGPTSVFVQRGEGGQDNTATIPRDIHVDELDPPLVREIIENKSKGKIELGQDETTGETIYAIEGPYGPYVQRGNNGDKKKKPKRCGLPKGMTLEEVDLKLARELLSLPRTLGAHPETGDAIKAGLGRFGPFVQQGSDFRSLPKEDSVFTVTLERALELLAQPKKSRRTRQAKQALKVLGKHPKSGKELGVYKGRYGPYISDGKVNAKIPKGDDPEEVTLEQAVEWIEDAESKKKKK